MITWYIGDKDEDVTIVSLIQETCFRVMTTVLWTVLYIEIYIIVFFCTKFF